MTDCSSKTAPTLFDIHPPLDLTRRRGRGRGVVGGVMVDVGGGGDSSVESIGSNSDGGDYSKRSTQKSEIDSEGERTSPGTSPPGGREVKSEDHSSASSSSVSSFAPDPLRDPLFDRGHSIGRFMNYVHQMNSMAIARHQYLQHHPHHPHHALAPPPPAPLLPPEILPPLVPHFRLSQPPLARQVPCIKTIEDKRQNQHHHQQQQTPPSKPPVKDESYFERRRKNNEAAKRSRDLRRIKEEEMAKRAKLLENENSILRAENNVLKFEIRRLHSLLSNTLNSSSSGGSNNSNNSNSNSNNSNNNSNNQDR